MQLGVQSAMCGSNPAALKLRARSSAAGARAPVINTRSGICPPHAAALRGAGRLQGRDFDRKWRARLRQQRRQRPLRLRRMRSLDSERDAGGRAQRAPLVRWRRLRDGRFNLAREEDSATPAPDIGNPPLDGLYRAKRRSAWAWRVEELDHVIKPHAHHRLAGAAKVRDNGAMPVGCAQALELEADGILVEM